MIVENVSLEAVGKSRFNPLRSGDKVPEGSCIIVIKEHSKLDKSKRFIVPLYDIDRFVNQLELLLETEEPYEAGIYDLDHMNARRTTSRGNFYCSVCKGTDKKEEYTKMHCAYGSPIIHDECVKDLIDEIKKIRENNKDLVIREKNRKTLSSL